MEIKRIFIWFSGLIKLRELARSPKLKDIEIYMRQADPGTYKQILAESKSKEIRNFIVDTKSKNMHLFLNTVSFFSY